jgi:hypothetical protein
MLGASLNTAQKPAKTRQGIAIPSSAFSTSAKRGAQGTLKDTLLDSVPLGVATWTLPVVAPAGTAVVISEAETTVKAAAVPLNLTLSRR